MHERSAHHNLGLISLAAAVVIAAIVLGGGIRDIKRADDTVTATGSARRAIRSDYAIWRGSISTQHTSLQDAYGELKAYTERLRAFLEANRVADDAVTFRAVMNNEIQEWLPQGGSTGRILAYRLTQEFEIRSPQVDSIEALSRRAADLIAVGVPLAAAPPQFLFTGLGDLRVELLADATRDAKTRAEKIAEGAGAKVGPIRNARVGVFQITPPHSTDVSDYGYYDTSSIDKDVTAVVTLSFALN